MRTKIAFLELRRKEIRACLRPSNQIFIFLKQLLENNTNQRDNFFGLTCPVLSWLPIRLNDLRFRKKKRKV